MKKSIHGTPDSDSNWPRELVPFLTKRSNVRPDDHIIISFRIILSKLR